MRYYSYVVSDDDISITKRIYSEEEILAEFWEFWTAEMRGNGFADLISKENCINDWVAYNWAQPEDVYVFKTGYHGKVFCINEFDPTDPFFDRISLTCLNDNSIKIDRFVSISRELYGLTEENNITLR